MRLMEVIIVAFIAFPFAISKFDDFDCHCQTVRSCVIDGLCGIWWLLSSVTWERWQLSELMLGRSSSSTSVPFSWKNHFLMVIRKYSHCPSASTGLMIIMRQLHNYQVESWSQTIARHHHAKRRSTISISAPVTAIHTERQNDLTYTKTIVNRTQCAVHNKRIAFSISTVPGIVSQSGCLHWIRRIPKITQKAKGVCET